ncbi:MAG: tyrosine decarboxylase [Chloroflexi bacterium]|nr:MAG: tyrosine decarboxylase [Chloroflexota bacterium]
MKSANIKAVFIGDKSENGDTYLRLMNKLMEEHLGWRENYIPEDLEAISIEDKHAKNFIETTEHMESVLNEVSIRLRSGSIPWQSERYWGHMNSETLMPSLIAYNFAMLWNSNNVALESSMGTSQMEAEVAVDFAKLFDFENGWGHLSADGSVANLEGLWYARSFKSIPLAIKDVLPEKVAGKTEWELLNMSVEETLDMLKTFTPEEIDKTKAASSRSGKHISDLGKWFVPQTKHYSWEKAMDISGVGLDNIVNIPVNPNYRMDVNVLEDEIRKCVENKTPILGVVAVVGTTEEGQVDEVHKIVELRDKLMKEGVYFYLHVDAAYGGYGRTLFIDEDSNYVEYDKLNEMFKKYDVFKYPVKISEEVYNGYKAIKYAESVTIDPHKMGYVPYAAGGIVIKHKDMRNIISYFASYVFEKNTKSAPNLLGAYILEGSKAGATAAAVWTAHRVLPLNITGYGKLIGASVEAAQKFREYISGITFNIKGKEVEVFPLNHPDFNMVDWAFKVKGTTNLAEVNELNEKMYDYSSYMDGHVYNNRFITSHTIFDYDGYGDSPLPFVESMGINKEEWNRVHSVTLLRACILSPYLNDDKVFDYYTKAITESIEKKLNEILVKP